MERSWLLYQLRRVKSRPDPFILFKEAVDSYLNDCKIDGVTSIKPCKGSFNVRVGHDLHLAAAVASHRASVNLNEFMKQALAEKLQHCEA